MIRLFRREGVWYLRSNFEGKQHCWSLRTRDEPTARGLRDKTEVEELVRMFEPRLNRGTRQVSIGKRGGVWWATAGGDHFSLRTRSERVAREVVRRLTVGELTVPIWWPELADEFERWVAPQVKLSTLRRYLFVMKRFGEFLGARSLRVNEITSATVGAYIEGRQGDQHPTRGTRFGTGGAAVDLRILHRIFSYALDRRYVLANPVGSVESAPPAMPVLTVRRVERVVIRESTSKTTPLEETSGYIVAQDVQRAMPAFEKLCAEMRALPKRARANARKASQLLAGRGYTEHQIEAATKAPGTPKEAARWFVSLERRMAYPTVAAYHKKHWRSVPQSV